MQGPIARHNRRRRDPPGRQGAGLVVADAWVVALGKAHGARDRAAALAVGAARDARAAMATSSGERWTHIAGAMARLVSAYNVSVDRDVLSVAEDRSDANRPVITIRSGGEGSPSLVAALEGTLICVRSRGAQGLSWDVQRPLLADRDDDQTAAYLLQQWMEQL